MDDADKLRSDVRIPSSKVTKHDSYLYLSVMTDFKKVVPGMQNPYCRHFPHTRKEGNEVSIRCSGHVPVVVQWP